MSQAPSIRPLVASDIEHVAAIHQVAFPRQLESLLWISCNAAAYPRIRYFVAIEDGKIVGYIQWAEKSGFRKEVVLELEQMAVLPENRGRGIARALIRQSLPQVARELEKRGAAIKAVMVTTRTDNAAQRIYASMLGAIPRAIIPDLYSADEVIMIALSPDGSGW
ncbi:GNAT family N-acetyltransferase [Cupriavidus sp. NPDC089707]|uniref:GNAT family N-acetyltransferase n=1 Tax=Cupriavidus sp. NPDC089707 TaxID=3363963 RepID=UPI0037F7AAAC